MGRIDTFKRKEFKYMLSNNQKEAVLKAISDYIEPDEYDKYTICNVYMDTPDNLLIRRSIEKPEYKEKMRLRSYGVAGDDQKVFIELKKKYAGIVYKRRVRLYLDEALSYIEGNASRTGQIESEIDYFINLYEGISPAMYIAYDRQAYHGKDNPDVRITFDDNILWRDEDVSLTSEIYGNKVLEDGQSLLEIKCGDAMPLWLTKALSENRIYKTSFSKYGKAYAQKLA